MPAPEQPPDDPLNSPMASFEGVLACLSLLLPERPLQVLPGDLVASTAPALDDDVLDAGRTRERREAPRHREREGDDGVNQRGTARRTRAKSAMMAGLRMGDVIKNDMAPENGAPLLKSPTSTGWWSMSRTASPPRAPRRARRW